MTFDYPYAIINEPSENLSIVFHSQFSAVRQFHSFA